METKKKQFKMPHTFVIIGIIILFAVLLTWICLLYTSDAADEL